MGVKNRREKFFASDENIKTADLQLHQTVAERIGVGAGRGKMFGQSVATDLDGGDEA
jgi:hypothetical protein